MRLNSIRFGCPWQAPADFHCDSESGGADMERNGGAVRDDKAQARVGWAKRSGAS